jgi:very-short-patch-repair endonuclease
MTFINETELTRLKSLYYLNLQILKKSILWLDLEHYYQKGIILPRQILHHYELRTDLIPTCKCGNLLEWHPDKRDYRKYCSKRCTAVYTEVQRKETSLEKYGVEWFSQTAEWKDKVENTSLEKFGKTHYSQTEEYLQKSKETNLERYGVERPAQSDVIRQKMKDTCQERYGVDQAFSAPTVIQTIRNSCLQKYGTEFPMQLQETQQKAKNTCQDRYGVDFVMQDNSIKSKSIKTRKDQHWAPGVYDKITNKDWLYEQNQSLCIGELSDVLNISPSYLCNIFRHFNIDIKRYNTTYLEKKFLSHFTALGINIQLKNRLIIKPLEIDIVFPDIKLGIEINGAYWHSEEMKSDPNYHLNKTILANAAGYELWHFWDWELNGNWDLIISKVEHKLGLASKVFARKLSIDVVNNEDKKLFLINNHIQGSCQSKVNIGLYDSTNQLLIIGTFGRSRYNKNVNWELLRLAAKRGNAVIGGASKILSYFKKNFMVDGDTLISYCQRRFSNGNVYTRLNFKQTHITSPGYVYIHNGYPVGSRQQWQKHLLKDRLPIFDANLTANDNMNNNGYYRGWDCGQLVFKMTK